MDGFSVGTAGPVMDEAKATLHVTASEMDDSRFRDTLAVFLKNLPISPTFPYHFPPFLRTNMHDCGPFMIMP